MKPKRRGSLKNTVASDDIVKTTWSCRPASAGGSAAVAARIRRGTIPTCRGASAASRPTTDAARRYLARRVSAVTRHPSSRARKRRGNRVRRSARWSVTRSKRAPCIAGSSSRRVASTSGSSGNYWSIPATGAPRTGQPFVTQLDTASHISKLPCLSLSGPARGLRAFGGIPRAERCCAHARHHTRGNDEKVAFGEENRLEEAVLGEIAPGDPRHGGRRAGAGDRLADRRNCGLGAVGSGQGQEVQGHARLRRRQAVGRGPDADAAGSGRSRRRI